ncbi:MAG: putative colanic acid biosynthesis acetyltransferase [Opitutaceae bacterium]|nr:putative colanic acid biosynthesis acetyltransferase [Opitutaceae bacterium]
MSDDAPYLGRNCVTPYPKSEVARRWLWLLVQATLFRWSPRPWHGWRAWLLRRFGAEIAGPVVVFPTVRVVFPWRLHLAARSMLGPHVIVYNLAPVRLGFGANVSQHAHLCAGTHDFARWDMPLVTAPITVGPNAWLGADVFVGPGVTIGELCVVGARSVVVQDLPPRHVCVGSPCRPARVRPDPA